jgi:palmitoyltransferase ZDHHC13/17
MAKTSNGLNALHLASQKNMVLPFLYFKDRISLADVDNMNSTPLHWAAYMNSEEVVAYILSVSHISFLNKRDSEGNTPLMLAVTYGNTRVVRRLLIKGANRYIRNNEGTLPI